MAEAEGDGAAEAAKGGGLVRLTRPWLGLQKPIVVMNSEASLVLFHHLLPKLSGILRVVLSSAYDDDAWQVGVDICEPEPTFTSASLGVAYVAP